MPSSELAAGRAAARYSGEPELEFAGLAGAKSPTNAAVRRRSMLIGFSIAIHTVTVGALLVVPLLRDAPLPDPTQAVRAFFVAPSFAPPPPPPPPAPASKLASRVVPVAQTAKPNAFVAPTQIPDSIEVPEDVDPGVSGGVAGGVEGGVAGGVVGSLVGGLGNAPSVTAPLRVGGGIREPRKLKNVDPTYPSVARAARIQGVVVIECVVGTDGRVADAKVVQGQPLLDGAALKAVQQWRYTPTLYEGVPVPVILTVTVTFRLA